jgi:formylglycine-generating enzyme required for sulfatase activity/predicted Ser/Thr protein kinase
MSTDSSTVTSTLVGSLAPGTLLHEYRIEGVLGHGGFGITYLARDMHLDKKVAIKEYLPNDLAARAADQAVTVRSPESSEAFQWGLQSFIKEARVLAKFSHPSLIQVHRYFEANQTAYFVMEYAEGVTLSTVLRHEGNVTEDRLRKILMPILNGLEEVHRLGVLHRDIKPDNIILREGATAVLIDFGAARQNLSSMTRSVMSVLTAGYAPIEQYATGGNQGPWTDLYAIGAVAYRALSGKKPIDAINRIREDPMVPAALLGQGRFSEHFLAAIDWALAVNPEDRPTSVAEFKAALDGSKKPPLLTGSRRRDENDVTPIHRRTLPEPESDRTVISQITPLDLGAKPAWPKYAAIGAVVAAALVGGLALLMRDPSPESAPAQPAQTAPVTAETPATATSEPATQPSAPATASPPPGQPTTEEPTAAAQEPQAAAEQAAPATTKPTSKPAPATAKAVERKPAPLPARMVPVAKMTPLAVFQDCTLCPLMVPLEAGAYQMGAQAIDNGNPWEGPARAVKLAKPFAIGRHEVTVTEWQACVTAKACPAAARGPVSKQPIAKAPVVNVSWGDAQAYVGWLSETTGRRYRLPSESEWEFAIRARTASARYWGGDRRLQCRYGNGADVSAVKKDAKLSGAECDDGFAQLAPVGAFEPNAFGLYDMAGNAWEWVQDCWRDTYQGAPANGTALELPGCTARVIRGGSWRARPNSLRSFGRGNAAATTRGEDLGLRVAAE